MRWIDKQTGKVPSKLVLNLIEEKRISLLDTVTDLHGGITPETKGMTLSEIQSWAHFIENRNWTFFVTFTTAYDSTQKTMRRLNRRYFDALKRYGESSLEYFWVMEKHKHRGYHTHGLLNFYDLKSGSDSESLAEAWKIVMNEYIRCAGKLEDYGHHRNSISLFDNQGDAAKYCMKYMGKSCTDWDFFLNC
jgi:hypothetical protein